MGLEYHDRDGCGAYVTCEACPFCGRDLEGERSLADHIRNNCSGDSDE